MINYSVVVPIHNEEDSIEPLISEILNVMPGLEAPYEIILVNDGSSDCSGQKIDQCQKEFPEVIHAHHMLKRSGQTLALRKGMESAQGEVVITLDGDLQNDPRDIPLLISKLAEGYDCVCGWRKKRKDHFLKKILSKCGNILQRILTGIAIHDISCTLRAYKRECLKAIPLSWEGQHRFIPLCLSLQGYKIQEIISNHRLRAYGESKYQHKRIFKVIFDFFKILKTRGRK